MEEGGDGYERYYEDYDEDMRLEVENFERYPEQEDREYSDIEDIILSYFEEGKQLIAKFHIHPVNDLVEALHKKLNLEKKYITFPSEDDVERTIKWRELLKKIYGYEFKPLEIIGSKINGKVEVNVFMINPEKINEYGSIPEASDNLSDYENGYFTCQVVKI